MIDPNEIHTNYRPTDWTDRLMIAAALLGIVLLLTLIKWFIYA
jgi:hypothetical protein